MPTKIFGKNACSKLLDVKISCKDPPSLPPSLPPARDPPDS